MNVAIITTNAPPLMGGLEKVGLRLAQNLNMTGDKAWITARFCQSRHNLKEYFSAFESGDFDYENTRIKLIKPGPLQRFLIGQCFPLIWRKSTFGIARSLYARSLQNELRYHLKGADILHYLGSGPELLGFAVLHVSKSMNIPVFVEPAMHPGQWGDGWIDKILYKEADKILAHTQYEAGAIERMGVNSNKVSVIVHGVDFNQGGSGERFRQRYQIKGTIILFLGRKTEAKGVKRLVYAFLEIKNTCPDAVLVLAGPANPNLDLPTDGSILNLDDLSEQEKEDALASCDVFCVPSEGESFGMVYFEAWAYKKPVIAMNLPSLQESIGAGKGGILTDEEGLPAALVKLLNESDLRMEYGVNGYNLLKNHSWDKSVRSYKQLYSEVLRN